MENFTPGQTAPSISELGTRVKDDFNELRDAALERRQELVRAATDFIHEKPLLALGAAFGVGFVLAGGLFSKTTARLALLGGRFYAKRFITEFLGEAAGDLFRGAGSSSSATTQGGF